MAEWFQVDERESRNMPPEGVSCSLVDLKRAAHPA
jgi:hypothetical protein